MMFLFGGIVSGRTEVSQMKDFLSIFFFVQESMLTMKALLWIFLIEVSLNSTQTVEAGK